ncbi:MAG: hypothetical protein R3267_02030 [Paenisporosarcina sp.]|nr:hypothetical protein [Paenisporosarcina sp.]
MNDELKYIIGCEMIEEVFIEVLSMEFVVFIAISLIIDLFSSTYSMQDVISIIFGVIGLIGVTFLAFYIEVRLTRQKNLK